jgi:poly(A) polymerase
MVPESVKQHVKCLAEAFAANDKQLYLVGGTVRDFLLKREPHDIDCTTDAWPDQVRQIAATTNPRYIVAIGEKFGTLQLHYGIEADPLVVEVTTFRGERYQPGSRKPEVQFGTSLHEDLLRRDFTINAIAMNALTDELVDPFGGRRDIALKFIQAVGDPARRFIDDPLRLLRAVRLATQLDFIVTSQTWYAIIQQAPQLALISQERIRDEFSKILLAPRVLLSLENLLDWKLFAVFLPEVAALERIWQHPHHTDDVFDHTCSVVQLTPQRLTVRLAALLHDIAKPLTRSVDEQGMTHFYHHEHLGSEMARTILRRLRFGNDVVEHVATVVKLHMRVNAYTSQWSNGAVRRLFVDAGANGQLSILEDLLDLGLADGISDRPEPKEAVRTRIEQLKARLAKVRVEAAQRPLISPLNGDALMALFQRPPGPWLKGLKAYLSGLVIEGTLQPGDADGAVAEAKKYMENNATSNLADKKG